MSLICLYPFTRMDINDFKFVPCCKYWLKDEFYLLTGDGEDPWNSPAAIELRSKIFAGDYSLCKREICNSPLINILDLKKNGSPIPECPIDQNVIEAIEKKQVVLDYSPTSLSISIDSRCNLSCPSCRDNKITTLSNRERKNIISFLGFLKNNRKNLIFVKMSGHGEVLFGDWQKKLLEHFNNKNFPNLKEISILTNGLLFTPKAYAKLSSQSELISEISVSIDAGDCETYTSVRGGDWNKLLLNLKFIASLRSEKKLKRFIISFVIRKTNLHSIENFIKLGEELKCDVIYFTVLEKWKGATNINYLEEAIHLKSHSHHNLFKETYLKIKNHPNVVINYQN